MNMAKVLQQRGIPSVQKMFDSKLGSFVQKAIPNLLSNNIISGFTCAEPQNGGEVDSICSRKNPA